jgi:GNAT superfamily N-acetyltransferase
MEIEIKQLKDTNYTYEQLVNLLHDSFQERMDQGLLFTSCSMDVDTFKRRYSDGVIIVGYDEDSRDLLALFTFHLRTKGRKRIHKYGYLEQLAVSPKAKRTGIGTKMLDAILAIAQPMGASYMLSDTACKAESSVRWHYKNMFLLYQFESYRSTNYWSKVFKLYLPKGTNTLNRRISCRIHYWLSWVFIRLTRDIHGKDTSLGRLYKRLSGKEIV